MQHYHVRHPKTASVEWPQWWSEKKGWGDRKDATLFSAVELNRLIDSCRVWEESSHTSHAWAESHFPNTLKAYIAGTLSLDPRQTVPVSDLEILSLAKNNGKKKSKRKKARAAKKRQQQRAVERGDVQVSRRSEVAEGMIIRRMGTGGSGYHEPSRRQKTRAARRASRQKGYAEDNPRKLKTFKAGRAPIRWRRITKNLPSSGFYSLRPDFLWVGYTKIPSGVLARRKLSDVEMLAEALEPDWKEGQWSQHVMIAQTHLHPSEWRKHLHDWKGPDPDRFRWSRWAGESISGVPESELNALKPGEAKFKIHKTYPLRQNPRYGSLPAIGHAKDALQQAGFDYDSIELVRKARGANGPVYVFRAVKRGVLYDVNAGRPARTDYVEVRSAPAKVDGPAQLPLFGKKNPPVKNPMSHAGFDLTVEAILQADTDYEREVSKAIFAAKGKKRKQLVRLLDRLRRERAELSRMYPDAFPERTVDRFGRPLKTNPGLESDFDPREWQTHAQVDKIYGTFMEKLYGADSFRSPDQRQMRLDAMALMRSKDKDQVIAQSRDKLGKAFGTTIGRGQKYGWFYPGTRTPTPKTAKKSLQRYQGHYKGSDGKVRTLDDLVNGRQSYEETLGFSRKSGFYRITQEPTQAGPRWFVWPMVPGQRIPGPGASQTEAQRLADKLNRTADPRATNEWHVPECNYTKAELADWLPPARVFEAGLSSAAPVAPKPKRKARPATRRRGKPVATPVVPDLAVRRRRQAGGVVFFIEDKSGKQVGPDFTTGLEAWQELQRRQAA